MEQLLIRPYPRKNEGFIGYLMRVAEANLYSDWRWVGRWLSPDGTLGLVHEALSGESVALREMSARLRVNQYRLTEMVYRSSHDPSGMKDGNFISLLRLLGEPLFDGINVPLCASCLNEGGVVQRSWECVLFGWCPLHRKPLIARCPNCRKTLSSQRPRLYFCSCGFDIRLSRTRFFPPAGPDTISAVIDSFVINGDRKFTRGLERVRDMIMWTVIMNSRGSLSNRRIEDLRRSVRAKDRSWFVGMMPLINKIFRSQSCYIKEVDKYLAQANGTRLSWLIKKGPEIFPADYEGFLGLLLQLRKWKEPVRHHSIEQPTDIRPRPFLRYENGGELLNKAFKSVIMRNP